IRRDSRDACDRLGVAHERRLQDPVNPGRARRRLECGIRIGQGPRRGVGGDDQPAASVEVAFHEVPLRRVEGRILFQADLPDYGAAALEDRDVRGSEIRDVPHRCRPPVASEGGQIGRFALRREGVAADHEEDVAETIVALIALVSTTATSWIVGPLASICAVAVAVWAGDTSWYVAVIVSPSRTWRNPSVTGVPKAVRIEPRQISSPPPPLKVTS